MEDNKTRTVPKFYAHSWCGAMVVVDLDQTTNDFAHLINQPVLIDGEMCTCLAVEKGTHGAPWHSGETIGLIVERMKPRRVE